MADAVRHAGRPPAVLRLLGAAGWAVIALGFAVVSAVSTGAPAARQDALVCTLIVFFAVQVIRLAAAIALLPGRRFGLTAMLVSVVLWATGSAVLNGASLPARTHFPAPGELLFLASYVSLALALVSTGRRYLRRPLDSWLHVAVICGGTVSSAGLLLLAPAAATSRADGVGLLLALLYPIVDIALAALVVGQLALGAREELRRGLQLVAGLLCFAFADVHFVTDAGAGTYAFPVLLDAAWGAGFALLVGAACRPPAALGRPAPRHESTVETIAAAAVAILVLVLRPDSRLGLVLTVPAVVALLGAGGRLVLALREARGAAAALALSRTDDLTLLPNRRALREALEGALTGGGVTLMLLDVDGFKDVNDTLGHAAGDQVLQVIAHRLTAGVPPHMTVARLGGDEFAVLGTRGDALVATETARALDTALREPLRVDEIEIIPSASIGVAGPFGVDVSPTEALRRADVAMYQAKSTGTSVALYDPLQDDFSKAKLAVAEDLRRALKERQLELWYQPQVDAVTRELCGLEALVRWRHPHDGVMSPAVFLPAARRAGLMPAVTAEVVRLAATDLATLRRSGVTVPVALNCAPPELLAGTFVPQLVDAVARAGLPASAIVVEVTEDSFMAEPERARRVLLELSRRGFGISIDDYGTGFSSLSYLRDLPVDELKIDRTFVTAMGTDPRSRMIVASTQHLALALGLRTVAEGVEDDETAADLTALGVDVLQGYALAQPLPLRELLRWSGGRAGTGPVPTDLGRLGDADLAAALRRSSRVLAPATRPAGRTDEQRPAGRRPERAGEHR